jgi:hypothetical protein
MEMLDEALSPKASRKSVSQPIEFLQAQLKK